MEETGKVWSIYMHTSLDTGKAYIGLTCKTPHERWLEHCCSARRGSTLHFHNALNAYGFDRWEHSVLESGIQNVESANVLEKYYIQKYDTFKNGYNLTIGGGAIVLSEETEMYRLKRLKEALKEYHNKVPQEFWDYNTNTKYFMLSGDLEVHLGIGQGGLCCVSTGGCKSREGIALYSTYLSGYSPFSKEFSFEHPEHGVFNGSINMLVKAYPECKYAGVHSIASGDKKSYKKWTLAGCQHYLYKKGCGPKCVTIKATEVDTLEETIFTSYTKAAEYFGIPRHKVKHAINNSKLINRFKVERV